MFVYLFFLLFVFSSNSLSGCRPMSYKDIKEMVENDSLTPSDISIRLTTEKSSFKELLQGNLQGGRWLQTRVFIFILAITLGRIAGQQKGTGNTSRFSAMSDSYLCIYLLDDNLTTGCSLTGAISSCHVELSENTTIQENNSKHKEKAKTNTLYN